MLSSKLKNIIDFSFISMRTVGIQGANTIALAGELGLEKEILAIPFGHPSTKNRLVSVS